VRDRPPRLSFGEAKDFGKIHPAIKGRRSVPISAPWYERGPGIGGIFFKTGTYGAFQSPNRNIFHQLIHNEDFILFTSLTLRIVRVTIEWLAG